MHIQTQEATYAAEKLALHGATQESWVDSGVASGIGEPFFEEPFLGAATSWLILEPPPGSQEPFFMTI